MGTALHTLIQPQTQAPQPEVCEPRATPRGRGRSDLHTARQALRAGPCETSGTLESWHPQLVAAGRGVVEPPCSGKRVARGSVRSSGDNNLDSRRLGEVHTTAT